jgi:L-asparaginase
VTVHVSAFFLGGTIGMAGHHGGVVDRLTAEDLVASVPQLASVDVELDVRNFRALPSACLSFEDVIELVAAAEQSRADGVVVVQGTDTLEETAYLIDLLWPHDIPIVITGAMRNPSMAGSDGAANLLAAVQSAASPGSTGSAPWSCSTTRSTPLASPARRTARVRRRSPRRTPAPWR